MRLVDIFYKNIEGQLSEAKGNINVIGHLMMMHNEYNNSATITSGYFEIDGSIIKNAHINYNKLFQSLVTGVSPNKTMAWVSGGDIVLSTNTGLIGVKAASGGFSGAYISQQLETHTHNYWQGEQVYEPTSSALTQKNPSQYSMRFFIYHGVH